MATPDTFDLHALIGNVKKAAGAKKAAGEFLRSTPPVRILDLPAVIERTSLSRSGIYAKKAAGEFPAPIRLGPRRVGWLESAIENWLQQRIEDGRIAA